MDRGFTFIEMVISLLILTLLLTVAAPSFHAVLEKLKVERLAAEVQGFFYQAKSEAVLRHQTLYWHFIPYGEVISGEWIMVVTAQENSPNVTDAMDQAIIYLDGQAFQGMNVAFSHNIDILRFEGVNGKPLQSGHIRFGFPQRPYLSLIFHNITGRARLCGEEYGYPAC